MDIQPAGTTNIGTPPSHNIKVKASIVATVHRLAGLSGLMVILMALLAVVEGNDASARNKQQTLTVHTEAGCLIEGDFSRLREALDNLVSNAVKYSPWA